MAKSSSGKIPNLTEIVKAAETSMEATAQIIQIAVKNVNFIRDQNVEAFIKDADNVSKASDAAQKLMGGVDALMSTIKNVNDNFKIKDIILFNHRVKILKRVMNKSLKKFADLGKIDDKKFIDHKEVADKMSNIKDIFESFQSAVDAIKKIKLNFAALKFKRIYKLLVHIQDLLRYIDKMKVSKRAEKKMASLKLIIGSLGFLIASIILVTPIMVIFILLSPIILLCFWIFFKILHFLVKIIAKALSPKVFLTLILLGMVLGMLAGIAIILLLLTLLIKPLIKGIPSLLLFFAVILGIGLILAGIGALAAFAAPLIIAATILIGLITFAVGLVLLTAFALYLLQVIELDPDKIKENVSIVMSTAMFVILSIFDGEDEDSESSDKGWFKKVIGKFLKGFMFIIGAILAVAYLALIFGCIALILAIAAALRLLQIIDLDPDKIKENIKIVMDTAMFVVSNIFKKGDEDSEESDKSWIRSVIEDWLEGIASIVTAILAIAYLAIMIVAIAFIVMIAAELRLLQEIELDSEKVSSNVALVIETAQYVVDSIFDPQDDKDNPSKKSFIEKVLGFLGLTGILNIIKAIMAVAFLALTMLCIGMIKKMAENLKIIQEIDLDKAAIKDKVEIVIETAQMVVDSVYDRKDDKDNPSKKSNLPTFLRWILPDALASVIDAIMTIAFLALTNSCIGIIKEMAENLAYIQTIEFDEPAIRKNVDVIIETAQHVIDMICQQDDTPIYNSNVKVNKLVAWLLGEETAKEMAIMGRVNRYFAVVSVVAQLAESLEKINKLPELTNIKEKVDTIINTSDQILRRLCTQDDFDDGDFEDKIECLKMAVPVFSDYVNKFIVSLVKLSPEDLTKFSTQNSTILTQLNKTAVSLSNDKDFDKGDSKKKLEIMQMAVPIFSDYISKYITQVIGLNLTKFPGNDDIILAQINKTAVSLSNDKDFNKGDSKKKLEIIKMAVPIFTDYINKYAREMSRLNLSRFEENNKIVLSAINTTTRKLTSGNKTSKGDVKENIKLIKQIFELLNEIGISSKNNFNDENIKNTKNVTQHYTGLINSINKLNVSKLREMSRLMSQMQTLSKKIGKNFERLADILQDEVAPTLDDIKTNMNESIDKFADRFGEENKLNIRAMQEIAQDGTASKSTLTSIGYTKEEQNTAEKTRLDKIKKDRKTTNNWDTLLYLLSDDGVKIQR